MAESYPPDEPAVVGRAAVRSYWESARQSGVAQLRIESEQVEANDNTAIEIGHSVVLDANAQATGRFRYLVVWKRTGDAWQIHREIWNTTPAQP